MINILYEDNHVLVVEKPANIPAQADSSKDMDFLTMLKEDIKVRYRKPGNVYLGLVHRLDRPVGGVMVFAKTSKAASRLSEQIRTHQIQKIYHTVITGTMPKYGELKDKLLKDTTTNMVKVHPSGKEAVLTYEVMNERNGYALVKVNLQTGRSHQIRVQFSTRCHPIYGDQRYNKDVTGKEQIALFASSLSFTHPITKEQMTFDLPLPKRKPWNLFE